MSGSELPVIKGLRPAEARFVKILVANPDLSETEALRRAGFTESVAVHPGRITESLRPYVEDIRRRAVEATLQEAYFDATEVLNELIRSLARQIAGLERLHAMLGHDIKELYSASGALHAVAEWPNVWRTRLVVEIETRESSKRSDDGVQAGDSKAWDKDGEVKKIKRESALAIEKEIRSAEKGINETLETIGRHINVRAFQQPNQDININITVSADEQRKLAAAEKRARRVIDVTPPLDSK